MSKAQLRKYDTNLSIDNYAQSAEKNKQVQDRNYSPLSVQNPNQEMTRDNKMSQIIRKESDSIAKRENKFKELMEYD